MLGPRLRSWLRSALHPQAMEREMHDELRFHVETRTEDLMRGGMEPDEAERQAGVEFGRLVRTKEACRKARGADVLHDLAADIRYGLRLLRRSPGRDTEHYDRA
jgi:putative ABC transport system permease protein